MKPVIYKCIIIDGTLTKYVNIETNKLCIIGVDNLGVESI